MASSGLTSELSMATTTDELNQETEETSLGDIIIGSHPIDTWSDFVEYTTSTKRKTSDEDVEQRCLEMKELLCPDDVFNPKG